MANKFGKFIFGTALIGAAVAGVYYYLNREESPEEGTDFAKDVDSFFDGRKEREYVSLDNSVNEEAKEALKNAVEAAAEAAESVAEDIGVVKDEAAETTEYAFEEL